VLKRVVLAVTLGALAVPGAAAAQESAEATVTVLEEYTERPPKRVENKDRFTPECCPSEAAARRISRLERERWGGPNINDRIGCESGWRYWIVNSIGAGGLLQFLAGTWAAMWPGTPRGVRIVHKRRVWKPVLLIREWSNGVTTRERTGSRVRQKRVRIRKGRLPSSPSRLHGWAAIRVGQMQPYGTSWVCGL
jgi:hypothetical protein